MRFYPRDQSLHYELHSRIFLENSRGYGTIVHSSGLYSPYSSHWSHTEHVLWARNSPLSMEIAGSIRKSVLLLTMGWAIWMIWNEQLLSFLATERGDYAMNMWNLTIANSLLMYAFPNITGIGLYGVDKHLAVGVSCESNKETTQGVPARLPL